MTVIDLSQVRQQREALQQAVEEAARDIGDELAAMAIRHADWAFSVSGPLAARDPEMAKIVNRGVRRILLAQVRRETPHKMRPIMLDWARVAYRDRLIQLIEKRDEKNGGAV